MQPGERIKEIRKKMKMNQEEFAKFLGFSKSYICMIEKNEVPISAKFLNIIRDKLGYSRDFILEGREKRDFKVIIELREKDKKIIEETEGTNFLENLIPIPIARGEISAGSPREVEESPDGVAVIYKSWAPNPENLTVIKIRGESMSPTIPDGSLVCIDHSQKNILFLNNKIVAFRVKSQASIKRLKILNKDVIIGEPDNKDPIFESERIVFKTIEEAEESIIGKVVWWWSYQK